MNELVLIVEDEKDVAQLLRYNLQKAGYRTVVAVDGDQALSIVRFNPPDLVLLDIMLPERDGWDICRLIRSSEQTDMPIIMITALDGEEFRLRGLRTGADDYITKPFSVREVLIKVDKLIARSSELKAQRARSSQSEAQLSYLVHELKNNVSVIGGYADLAYEKGSGGHYMERISSTADHMEQILEDTSVIIRIENGTALPVEPVELNSIVRESLDALENPHAGTSGKIHLVPGGDQWVWANRAAIRQILMNLVSNAIKYGRDSGGVRVAIEERTDGMELSVRDEGPGIPPEEHERVFDKFYRCPGTQNVKGSGLGLYVVRLLAEGMGGSVRITSDDGKGCCFTVTLRKTGAAAPAAQLPHSEPVGPQRTA